MEHHGASPGPSGLVAFAVACYTFVGVFSGMVVANDLLLLAAWLTGGFVVQIIVANKELDHGELLGGNVFCFFQGFFMLTGAISSICKWLCVFVFEVTYSTVVEGFGWGACTIALILWSPAYFKNANGTFSTAIIFTDIALIGVTLNDFGILPASLKIGVAICLFIAGSLGLYCASAVQLNTAFGKTVLPLAKPLIKSTASAK